MIFTFHLLISDDLVWSICVIVLSDRFCSFAFLLDLSLSAGRTNPEFLVKEAGLFAQAIRLSF